MKKEKRVIYLGLLLLAGLVASFPSMCQPGRDHKRQVEPDTADHRLVYINRIYIIGNKKTRRSIVTRELSVREGEYIPAVSLPVILEDDRNKIYNTNLFSKVEIQQLEIDSARIDLLIKLEERWYTYPVPIFELADRNFNDWWVNRKRDLSRVNYGLKLYQFNFRGRNERLKLVGRFGFETLLEANYRIPYIEASQRHGLAFDFAYSERKNVAYQTNDHLPTYVYNDNVLKHSTVGGITYSYRNSFYVYQHFNVGIFHTHIADTVAMLNRNYFGDGKTDQRAIKLSYVFSRDYRDNKNYTLEGLFYYAALEKVGIGIFNDVDIWRLSLNIHKYFDLNKGFYLANNFGSMVSTPKDQPYANYIGLGYGSSYVRGYELDLIEGHTYLYTKNSLRKRIWQGETDISRVMPIEQFQKIPFAIYAKVFFDGGWIDNYPNFEQSSRLTNEFLYGVGIGLDLVTLYDQMIRLEYSYNGQNEFNFFLNFTTEF